MENGGIVLGGGNFPIPVALRVGTEGPDKKRVLEGGNEEKKKIATTGGRQGKEKKEKKNVMGTSVVNSDLISS